MAKSIKLKQVEDASIRSPSKHIFDFSNALDISGKDFHRYRQNVMRYYYEHTKKADIVSYVKKWMKQQKYAPAALEHIDSVYVPPIAGVLAKLHFSGCPDVHQEEVSYAESLSNCGPVEPISASLKRLVESMLALTPKAQASEEVAELPKKKPVASIQDRMLDSLGEILDKWELYVDNGTPDKFDAYRELLSFKPDVKQAHARIIRSFFTDVYADILSEPRYKPLFDSIFDACSKVEVSTKVARKKKAVPNDKLVSNMKYCEKNLELNLASINPVDIIDAEVLYAYNTKTGMLTRYVADTPLKLAVKGTSVTQFCATKSEQKKLRKPADMLGALSKLNTPTKKSKYFDALTTKGKTPNGRVNIDTVLLYARK